MKTKPLSLYRKLIVTFTGLGFMALLVAGVTLWAMQTWQQTNSALDEHYQRSIILLEVRSLLFRAIKEVPDALSFGDTDAEEEFSEATEPAKEKFTRWAELAYSPEELKQVDEVSIAFRNVVNDCLLAFKLMRSGQRSAAIEQIENQLEKNSMVKFERLTEQAVASDLAYRQVVNSQVQLAISTVKSMLAIVAFGAISLLLLLFAYLASDLFAPLRNLRKALRAVTQGNYELQLPEGRGDELGEIQREYNRMIISIQSRQKAQVSVLGNTDISTWRNAPARHTLYRMLTELKQQTIELCGDEKSNQEIPSNKHNKDILEQLNALLETVSHFVDLGFPLDLNLSNTDVGALINNLLATHATELEQRSISYELLVNTDHKHILADRLKLHSALSELLSNAIASLPNHGGGHIGIRAINDPHDSHRLNIEIVDTGQGTDHRPEQEQQDANTNDQRPAIGLDYAQSIIEEHGGKLKFQSEVGLGTLACVSLPKH